jgi:DNA-binding transcriptional ArsR family regulator
MPGDETHEQLPGFDPSQDVVLDPHMLHGLAHPLRIRLRSELLTHGPATASQLATMIGESSGTTSYHLRQLAQYGFVVDEPDRGNGRERYWRAVHRSTWFDMSFADPAHRDAGGEYLRAVARLYADRVIRFADSIEVAPEQLGPEWTATATMSDWILDLDVEEAIELQRRFHELCLPFHHGRAEPREGTHRVVVQFQILPTAQENP